MPKHTYTLHAKQTQTTATYNYLLLFAIIGNATLSITLFVIFLFYQVFYHSTRVVYWEETVTVVGRVVLVEHQTYYLFPLTNNICIWNNSNNNIFACWLLNILTWGDLLLIRIYIHPCCVFWKMFLYQFRKKKCFSVFSLLNA